jgi:hypothetical protein
MKISWSITGGLFYCFFAILAGCASSELTDIWSDASFQSSPLKKMLVISTVKNAVHRRLWEDALSAELAKHNVAATPSYRLFPDMVPDTDQVIQIVRSNGFDGILVVRRLPFETKTQYKQAYMTNELNTRFDRRGDRFVTYYREIYHDAYIDSQKVDIRTFDIWATKNEGRMIWSATSQTPEPNSVPSIRPEIINLVISELRRQGIIASER